MAFHERVGQPCLKSEGREGGSPWDSKPPLFGLNIEEPLFSVTKDFATTKPRTSHFGNGPTDSQGSYRVLYFEGISRNHQRNGVSMCFYVFLDSFGHSSDIPPSSSPTIHALRFHMNALIFHLLALSLFPSTTVPTPARPQAPRR